MAAACGTQCTLLSPPLTAVCLLQMAHSSPLSACCFLPAAFCFVISFFLQEHCLSKGFLQYGNQSRFVGDTCLSRVQGKGRTKARRQRSEVRSVSSLLSHSRRHSGD